MDELETVKLSAEQKEVFPLFYNYVYFKKLDDTFYDFSPPYSNRLKSYAIYSQANKFISKIVNLAEIEEE